MTNYSRDLRVNPPIGEALAADILQCHSSALGIVKSEGLARILTEVKFVYVALKVGFADAVERASQTTFEQREGRFDGVRSHVTARVFLCAVVDRFVRAKVLADLFVDARLVRHQSGLLGDHVVQDRAQRHRADVRNVIRALLAVALDQRDNLHLMMKRARAGLVLALVAPERLINFNRRTVSAKLALGRNVHRFTDAVRHEPRGFVGHAKHALQLLGTDPLLGGAHKVGGVHPLMEGHLRAFKHGADCDAELHTAVTAEQQAGTMRSAVQSAVALGAAAVRADRAIGPAHRLKMLTSRVFVVESGFGVNCCCHVIAPGVKQ